MDGSPAQCVLYGVLDCARRTPDLVVSGINYGENLGNSTLVSGTVGAALQGGDMGIPSLAVSLETKKEYHYNHGQDVDWRAAMHWLRVFAQQALSSNPGPKMWRCSKSTSPPPPRRKRPGASPVRAANPTTSPVPQTATTPMTPS
jgi:5'/3'-nucleotidase SurE